MSENSLNAELASELFQRAREARECGNTRVERFFLDKAREIMGEESASIIDIRNAVVVGRIQCP